MAHSANGGRCIVKTPTGKWHTARPVQRGARHPASCMRRSVATVVLVPLVFAIVTVLPAGPATAAVAAGTGGQQWSAISSFPAEPEASSISCPSTSVCYVAGYNSSNAPELLATNDGGASWTPTALPSIAYTTIACPSTSTCYTPGYQANFVTTDGCGGVCLDVVVGLMCSAVVVGRDTHLPAADGIGRPAGQVSAGIGARIGEKVVSGDNRQGQRSRRPVTRTVRDDDRKCVGPIGRRCAFEGSPRGKPHERGQGTAAYRPCVTT